MRTPALSLLALGVALLVLPQTGGPVAAADDPATTPAADATNFRKTVVTDAMTWTTLRFDDSVRTIVDRGPIHTELGIYHGQPWHQDANGVTVPDEAPLGDPFAEAAAARSPSAYSAGTVTDADVTPPRHRNLIEFPAGADAVKIPAHFLRDRIYVPLTIAGHTLDFVLDTGESGFAITEDTARALGLPLYNPTAQFAAGPYTQYDTVVPLATIGSLTMRDVAMTTTPVIPGQSRTQAVAGILGFDFLVQLGVTIDYAHGQVVVAPANAWVPPQGRTVIRMPIHISTGVPLVRVAVNGQAGERFVLDTGASTALLVTGGFAHRHERLFAQRAPREPYAGIGGSFDVNRYVMREVSIEHVAFRDVNVLRADALDAYGAVDGIIGTSLLRYFTLDLHYADRTLYLTRNALVPPPPRRECNTTTIAWMFVLNDCIGTDDANPIIGLRSAPGV